MADEAKPDGSERERVDRMVYGLALVVALVAGVVAVLTAHDDAPADSEAPARETAPAREREPESPARADVGGVEIVEPTPGRSKAGPDYVPLLPEVPDLTTQPPPELPAVAEGEDPRFAELGAEMRFLSRARELLDEHPSEALGVLQQHRRRYPLGALREERDAFTIEALLSLEHVDEAERRYYDFSTDYPHSEFGPRLRGLMLRPPHQVGAVGR